MSSRSDVIPNTSSLAQRKRSSIKRFPPADSVVMDGRVHVGSSSITPSTNTSNGNYYPPNIRQSSPIALPHRSSSKTSQQIGRKPLAPTYQKLLDSSNTTDKKQDPCAQLPNGLIPLSMCGDGSVSSSKTPTRCKSYKDILLQTKPKASQMNDNHTLPNDHSTAQDPGTPVAYSTPVGGKRTGRRRRGRKNNSRNVKNQTSTSNAQSGTSSTIKRRSSVRKSVRSRHSSQPTITRSSSASSDGSIIDRPMLVNLFDLITDDHPQSLSTKMKKLNLSSINENKRQMIGKVRQTPKIKKPSVLKRSLIAERQLRKERRTSSEPPCAPDATELAETNEQQPSIMNEAQPNDQVKRAANRCDIKSIVACCDQQDMLIAKMLNELATLQDRAHVKYAHAPYHRKRTKRLVCGLHEVVKHLKLRNLHLVILASNLEGRATDDFIVSKSGSVVAVEPDESPQESGALVTVLNKIWLLTQHTDPITPILITAHRRRKLGNLCHKPGGVSVVGVISIAGAEDVATELLQLKSGINHLPAVSKVIINTS